LPGFNLEAKGLATREAIFRRETRNVFGVAVCRKSTRVHCLGKVAGNTQDNVMASAIGCSHILERIGSGQIRPLNVPVLCDFYFAVNASRCCIPESPISSQTAFEPTQMW
jgi:hypothetical protein